MRYGSAVHPDQKAFVREAIESGRLQREEDAVTQGLLLWEERERRRIEILAAVDKAQASLTRGEGRRVTTPEEARQLVEDIKRRGMGVHERIPPSPVAVSLPDGATFA